MGYFIFLRIRWQLSVETEYCPDTCRTISCQNQVCKAHLKIENQQRRLWRAVGFGGKLKNIFIPIDIWGTYNAFIPLPTTCSLSLERKRSALCQPSMGFTWVIRCLLEMSLAVKHRAGKQHLWCLDFTGVRV